MFTCLEILDESLEKSDEVFCSPDVSWDSLVQEIVWEDCSGHVSRCFSRATIKNMVTYLDSP